MIGVDFGRGALSSTQILQKKLLIQATRSGLSLAIESRPFQKILEVAPSRHTSVDRPTSQPLKLVNLHTAHRIQEEGQGQDLRTTEALSANDDTRSCSQRRRKAQRGDATRSLIDSSTCVKL